MTHPTQRPRRRLALTSILVTVAVVAGVATWLASPWGSPQSATQPTGPVVLLTGPEHGLSHRFGLALAASPGGAQGTVQAVVTTGSWENLDRLRRGDGAFALATADVVEAYLSAATAAPAAPAAQSIRAVARLHDSYLHVVVPTDSPVHRLADLAGRRVAIGAGAALVADRLLNTAGIDPTRDLTTLELAPREAVAALRSGDVDAFLMLDGVPSPDLATLPGRLVDLADVAGNLLSSRHCPAPECAVYHAGTLPAVSYRGLAVAITTVAVPTLLLSTTQVAAAVVGQVTGLVFDSAPRIAATIPAVRQIDRHTAIFTGAVPLHDGAKDYYRATKVAA